MNGGRRSGAGRKKGVPNKRTLARRAALEQSGKTPLDFLLARMHDDTVDPKERMHAAVSAAPYLHPRLASVDTKISGDIIIEVIKFGGMPTNKKP